MSLSNREELEISITMEKGESLPLSNKIPISFLPAVVVLARTSAIGSGTVRTLSLDLLQAIRWRGEC